MFLALSSDDFSIICKQSHNSVPYVLFSIVFAAASDDCEIISLSEECLLELLLSFLYFGDLFNKSCDACF